ncbi:MAG: acyl--CoA ligase [Clostridia bacterium]|nr:acyl--CoA ligase [Clostridia bacterium]
MTQQKTGFPSVDRPWLKYYSEEAINAPLPEMTMYQYIWENNKDYLSGVALRYYGAKITYGKLFETIKKAASAFYAMGVRPGDIVTIMSMHTPETICCIYALNYIGAVANMVYMTLSEKEILHTLKNTQSKMFFVLDVALERVQKIEKEIAVPVVVLGVADSMSLPVKVGYVLKEKPGKHNHMRFSDFIKRASTPAPLATDHAAPAIIVYTSGSTGEPKGVELTNDNINAVAFQYKYVDAAIERGDTILVFMPPFLSIGFCYLHMPICQGVILIICANPEQNNVVNEYVKNKPNHFVAAPSGVLMVVERNLKDYSFVKSLGAGGDSLSLDDERRINKILKEGGAKVKYSAGYGMTEFSATVVVNSNSANKEGTIGIPLLRTNVKVVDQYTNEELMYNNIGELCFNTPSQMKGYMNCEQENAETIESDVNGVKWIHTGDLGFVDEDGFVHYAGRIKRIYLTKSESEKDGTLYKIFPQRIEECLERLDTVKVCGAIVYEDKVRLHIPVAYVVLSEGIKDHESAIKTMYAALKDELPDHSQPESIHILDAMPMTASGKIDYRALENLAQREHPHA